jgi:cyclic beta-1,2-glucan synthetase
MAFRGLLPGGSGASAALREILDPRSGPVLPPIRAELFGVHHWAQHGRHLAESHRAARARAGAATFFPRLRSNVRTLALAHRYLGQQAGSGYDLSPAAEWLLDNFHLIEAHLKAIQEGLPRSYFRALPLLMDAPLAGLPRIYGVAWELVAHTDSAFDEDLLVAFLDAYQDARELTQSEMWALPTTLRVVLIENLRRLAERVAAQKAAREVAHLCADHIEHHTPDTLQVLAGQLDRRGVGEVFLAQMAQRLQSRRLSGQAEIRQWLTQALPDAAAVQLQQNADQAADNLSVSNALTALRAIGDADWPDVIARTSRLMHTMLGSPVFAAEDAATRSRTVHAIEQLAQRSGRSEVSLARALLAHMRAGEGDAALAGHWLEGPGRAALLHELGLQERLATRWRAAARRHALPAYLGTVGLATAGLVAWLLVGSTVGAGDGLAGSVWLALSALLMLFPASEAVVAVVHRLISESVRPRPLPRLALAAGIPPDHRVMVVIPSMLTDAASTQTLMHRLLLHHLANPERHAQFALLTDWVDADDAQAASDGALLAQAQSGVEDLNARFPAPAGEPLRFLLLHRPRRYSRSTRRWIGWERKRGKLEQLIAVLVGDGAGGDGDAPAFLDLGPLSRPAPGIQHVLTLDSDTQLPPGRLRALVGVAAHPANQPQLDAEGRRVRRGYAILQPRLVTPLPHPGQLTLFHWLFAGQCGLDPYSSASSEVYQDLFAEGSFSGKGLLHVQAMHAVLAGRLPEDQVLSHDLLEGAIARCAVVSDLSLVEDAPFHADVAASRVQRWMRGDWQLLPFLLRPRHWPMDGINRWKMADNLRRSLVAPAALALLALALAGVSVSPGAALALVLAAFMAGPLMGAVSGFAPSRDDLAKRHFYRLAGADMARALGAGLWHLAQLLQQALQALDAIGRALYRTLISRRLLLQWTTAAAAQAGARTDLPGTLRRHAAEPVLAAALLLALLAAGTPTPALAVGLCALWGAAPLWTWAVSRPRRRLRETPLSAGERAYLQAIARDTWRYFERCIGPQDQHLPPDNLQTLPQEIVAHRTSPTNIGLYLLSACCARTFGWIGTPDLLARLEATLATLDRMERQHGHLLNWYDTQTLAPLLPKYVSTVDSGNLSGHLLAVAQACLERAGMAEDALHAPRLHALAQRCQLAAWAPDYGFLYHRKRRLLHIGWRVAEQALDAAFYDMLASESRLTSLLAIAKGDVPVSHWASLGRLFYALGSTVGLRSWSGSMFEYLMPSLMLDEPEGSVLHDACCAALREQIAFAQAQGVPWGISESAYAVSDHTLAYQYAPQGVPRLALRRTPPDELVIAPYATALAAPLAPRLACRNFEALEALGARGAFGFIEALDFSPGRRAQGQACVPVATFMAHHQGMSIVALANVLHDGVVQRWGTAQPQVEAMLSLLHERAPREVSTLHEPPAEASPQALKDRAPGLQRELTPGAAAIEPTHLLSNGRYSVTLRANGAGWSRHGRTDLTRWRDDALRDEHGSFFFLRWWEPGQAAAAAGPVSLTQHPAPDADADYQCSFHADRVCFSAEWPALQAHTTVWVSPEDDIEFRQVELRNLGSRPLTVELSSVFEPTLSDARADESHPAFMNLFVGASWQPEHQALMFTRTPRLPTEPGLKLAHFLAHADTEREGEELGLRVQASRQAWRGRNRPVHAPQAATEPASAAAQVLDTGLDPVCALSAQLRIAPDSKVTLTFATAASDDAGQLHAIVDKYRQRRHVQRASLMSATLTRIRLRALRITPESFGAAQTLSTALVLNLSRAPPVHDGLAIEDASDACDRRLLWRFGISGERPMILVTAGVLHALGLLRALAQALRLWAWGGVACDLVFINAEPASYQMALQREMSALRDRHTADSAAWPNPGATRLHVLQADELSADEMASLQALARVQFHADDRPLLHHVQAWAALHERARSERERTATRVVGDEHLAAQTVRPASGDFDGASGEFRFEVGATRRPARPWINVLANPHFGMQLSESGGGCSWAVNSRLNQLTAWSNDPVADPPSEWLLLQDQRTGQAWSVAPSAWGAGNVSYHVAHGQGSSSIAHRRGELSVSASWCVDPETAVRQLRLRIVNLGSRTLLLRAVAIAEWMLGAQRQDRSTVQTQAPSVRRVGPVSTLLMATQREPSGGFGGGTAFLALVGEDGSETDDWTCDRRELFDARGRLVLPDHLGRRSGCGLDPCAALSTGLVVPPGALVERDFLLGWAASPGAARELAALAAAVPPAQRLAAVQRQWDALLGASVVKTPDPLFDVMVNRWLLYQTVSCRLWAKAAFYQAGGATGFRDQLQDALALAWAAPGMLREQILRCAGRQFEEGDVQHWWHAPGGAGVRTHFSDDLLWLPHACVHYLRATDDMALLDEQVPFLEGSAIPEGAEDIYETPGESAEQASVYEHAARTIDRSLRVGAHGLPLMGSGDWNDGMNRVGHEGRGESVWLGFFLCTLVAAFAPIARAGRARTCAALGSRGRRLEDGAHGCGLGRPLVPPRLLRRRPAARRAGQRRSRIDLIAQAWAVLSDARRRPAACGDGCRGGAADGCAGRPDPPARPAAGPRLAERRLHPGLPARCARERRPVFARGRVGADGAGGLRASRRCRRRRRRAAVPVLHLAQPGAPRGAPHARPGLWPGALCDGRRRLHP